MLKNQKLDANHFVLKEIEGKTYDVTASSTYSDAKTPIDVLSVDHLFNGKNESESGSEWVSLNSPSQFILVSFSEQVCVNTIWMTVRNENCNQFPNEFTLSASNDKEHFSVIAHFSVLNLFPNEKKFFTFDNDKSYCHYRLNFIKSGFGNQYGMLYGFSEMNLGNFQI